MTPVRYRIVPRDPHAHLFAVDCTIDDPARDGQRFALPAWIPGSYLIREFARHVVTIRAAPAAARCRRCRERARGPPPAGRRSSR
jgi:predicted metalloprotease with PDZ domain